MDEITKIETIDQYDQLFGIMTIRKERSSVWPQVK